MLDLASMVISFKQANRLKFLYWLSNHQTFLPKQENTILYMLLWDFKFIYVSMSIKKKSCRQQNSDICDI